MTSGGTHEKQEKTEPSVRPNGFHASRSSRRSPLTVELTGSIQGVLFLEYWLRNRESEELNQILTHLMPRQVAILSALMGSGNEQASLPSFVEVRRLAQAAETEKATQVYETADPHPERRLALQELLITPYRNTQKESP